MIKNALKHALLSAALMLVLSTSLSPIIIVIHGTFAVDCDWYLPDGDFFKVLKPAADERNEKIMSFSWSGNLSHAGRLAGAKSLAALISSYPNNEKITIIGHSHAGNVTNLASHLLYNPLDEAEKKQADENFEQIIQEMIKDLQAHKKSHAQDLTDAQSSVVKETTTEDEISASELKNEMLAARKEIQDTMHNTTKGTQATSHHRIETAYYLGTPVDKKAYLPNYFVIKHLKSFYSTGDLVQPVMGTCGRTYDKHSQLVNFRVQFAKDCTSSDKINPGHSELHDPIVGTWILDIFENLKELCVGGFASCNYGMNGEITFFNDLTPPCFEEESEI